jgi:hypothetical protein
MDLPVAGMLGGMPYGEERLLSLVGAYQAVTDWHRRRPSDPRVGGGGGAGERDEGEGRLPDAAAGMGVVKPTPRLDVHDVMAECE